MIDIGLIKLSRQKLLRRKMGSDDRRKQTRWNMSYQMIRSVAWAHAGKILRTDQNDPLPRFLYMQAQLSFRLSDLGHHSLQSGGTLFLR